MHAKRHLLTRQSNRDDEQVLQLSQREASRSLRQSEWIKFRSNILWAIIVIGSLAYICDRSNIFTSSNPVLLIILKDAFTVNSNLQKLWQSLAPAWTLIKSSEKIPRSDYSRYQIILALISSLVRILKPRGERASGIWCVVSRCLVFSCHCHGR